MGEIIRFDFANNDSKEENTAKVDIDNELLNLLKSWEISPENDPYWREISTEEMIRSNWETSLDISKLQSALKAGEEIVDFDQEHIQKYIFQQMLAFMVKEWKLSPQLYFCTEYISAIITKHFMNDIDIHQNVFELYDNDSLDFQLAADISFLRYVYKFEKKRKSLYKPKDFFDSAIMFYSMAHQYHKRQIWWYLSENLAYLDSNLVFRSFVPKVFSRKDLDL